LPSWRRFLQGGQDVGEARTAVSASAPSAVALLVGLGCDILPIAPAALEETRVRIRDLDHAACAELATRPLPPTQMA
jgi:phosphoenolpyruvate-protein kinase (PTS system EI component)